MKRFGQKITESDRNGPPKSIKADSYRQKQTKTDKN